jgi:hypothetical protein
MELKLEVKVQRLDSQEVDVFSSVIRRLLVSAHEKEENNK